MTVSPGAIQPNPIQPRLVKRFFIFSFFFIWLIFSQGYSSVYPFYMAAYEIEIILNRQLADCLSIPVFITDTKGTLIYYNEPAEEILGKRYDETGGNAC